MSAAFTPGPWTVILDANNAFNLRISSSDTPHVAKVYGWQAIDPRCVANAKLIAAAPELLAALEAICAEAAGMTMTMRRRMIFNDGLAALFKARGEA